MEVNSRDASEFDGPIGLQYFRISGRIAPSVLLPAFPSHQQGLRPYRLIHIINEM